MWWGVLVVGGDKRTEIPIGKSLKRGEFVVADDQDLNVLGFLKDFSDILGNVGEFETAEVELDGLLRPTIFRETLIDCLDQLLITHLI